MIMASSPPNCEINKSRISNFKKRVNVIVNLVNNKLTNIQGGELL